MGKGKGMNGGSEREMAWERWYKKNFFLGGVKEGDKNEGGEGLRSSTSP